MWLEEIKVVKGAGEYHNNSGWLHTYEEGMEAAKLCYIYLKPSGYIRCPVPDGYFPDKTYQEIVQVGGQGQKEHPAASHKVVHNYKTLSTMFEAPGYEVEIGLDD